MAKKKRHKNQRDPDMPHGLTTVLLKEAPSDNGEWVRVVSWPKDIAWQQVDVASGSDYNGGLVARSNYEGLSDLLEEEHPYGSKPVVWGVTTYSHGGFGIIVDWDRLGPESKAAIGGLDDYPLLDESKHSEMQIEAEQEAWENWAKRDFENYLEKHYDIWDFPESVDTYELFEQAREKANEYWEDTNEGVYIRVEAVAKAAVKIVDEDEDLSKTFSEAERRDNPSSRPTAKKLKSKLMR